MGAEDQNTHDRWVQTALVLGFNECAKQAETLGEKAYFRIRRDAAHEEFVKLGGEKFLHQAEPILEIRADERIWIRFSKSDIESMRQLVADYDMGRLTSSDSASK
jgi:hypothetical protein